jgi:hypothetical protein
MGVTVQKDTKDLQGVGLSQSCPVVYTMCYE